MLSRRWLSSTLIVPLIAACTPTNVPKQDLREVEFDAAPSPNERAGVRGASLTATFVPQYDVVAQGPDGTQQLNFMIRLVGDEDEDSSHRPSLDLAIVLDRSGSMTGDKLRYAKQAGLDLLMRLDERDRVTLITYDSDVSLHSTLLTADQDGIEQLRTDLLFLEPGSATALGPALFAALDGLGGRSPTADRLTHVVLLSDGLANEGETQPAVIGARTARGYQRGTTVSTLGMGTDYNEDLMTDIADQGGGRYHFIEDAQHIPAVLADEFAGLTSTIAADVSVEFAAHDPTHVDAVHGYVSTTRDDLTAIRVGYIAAGQTREIMARVEIPAEQLRGQIGDVLELGENHRALSSGARRRGRRRAHGHEGDTHPRDRHVGRIGGGRASLGAHRGDRARGRGRERSGDAAGYAGRRSQRLGHRRAPARRGQPRDREEGQAGYVRGGATPASRRGRRDRRRDRRARAGPGVRGRSQALHKRNKAMTYKKSKGSKTKTKTKTDQSDK